MPEFKRKKFIINDFQYKLLGFAGVYLIGIVVVFYAAGVFSLMGDLSDANLSVRQRGESAHVLLHLHNKLLPWLFPLVAAVALHSALVSHRIAGPIYRFSCVMKDIARGDLSMVVRLRKKDYLKAEAAILNEMIEELNSRILQAQECCSSVQGDLSRLEGGIEDHGATPFQQDTANLRASFDELSDVLSSFKTRERSSTIHEWQAPRDDGEASLPPAA